MSILGEEPVTLERRAANTVGNDGIVVRGAVTTSTIRGSFQPLAGEEIALLPDGERQADHRKFYTETELRTADQHAQTEADVVIVDGARYTVMQVQHQRKLIPHYKARLLREREGA